MPNIPPPWLRVRWRVVLDPAPAPLQTGWRARRLPPPWQRVRLWPCTSTEQQEAAQEDDGSGRLSRAGTNKPFVERVPDAPQRLRRHTEKVSDIFDSLMRLGQLYQDDVGRWVLVVGPDQIEVPGGPGGTGLTGTFP